MQQRRSYCTFFDGACQENRLRFYWLTALAPPTPARLLAFPPQAALHVVAARDFTGSPFFIEEARTINIKIALGSASKNSQLILERLHLTRLFDLIADGTKVF
jgi:beta-phosphoglucomutase-like phosphatase (HAD superfamily)